MATSNRDTFFNTLIAEYHHPFNGWDFSYLNGRRVDIHQQQHWNYAQIVTSAMKEAQRMLDMRTGGGERLAQYLAIQAVPEVHATEGYAPNVSAARQRLSPLGVTVYEVQDDQLPLPDASLDLIYGDRTHLSTQWASTLHAPAPVSDPDGSHPGLEPVLLAPSRRQAAASALVRS